MPTFQGQTARYTNRDIIRLARVEEIEKIEKGLVYLATGTVRRVMVHRPTSVPVFLAEGYAVSLRTKPVQDAFGV